MLFLKHPTAFFSERILEQRSADFDVQFPWLGYSVYSRGPGRPTSDIARRSPERVEFSTGGPRGASFGNDGWKRVGHPVLLYYHDASPTVDGKNPGRIGDAGFLPSTVGQIHSEGIRPSTHTHTAETCWDFLDWRFPGMKMIGTKIRKQVISWVIFIP